MSWIALLLIGVGVTDLVFSIRPMRLVPESLGAASVVGVGLLAGLTEWVDLVAILMIALVVLGWALTVTRGFARGGRPWIPLLLLGVALLVTLATSPAAGQGRGVLQDWLDSTPVDLLADRSADDLLLLLGAFLVQMSTGNVLVRLVLQVTGTLNPARQGMASDPETQLKGGRLLGPMERIFILGLGLAGQLTAASIVIAAKGLLRFPELSSKGEQERIHQLTEYFLLGSFVSWLVALSSLVLLA